VKIIYLSVWLVSGKCTRIYTTFRCHCTVPGDMMLCVHYKTSAENADLFVVVVVSRNHGPVVVKCVPTYRRWDGTGHVACCPPCR